jgi:hypothetical protein
MKVRISIQPVTSVTPDEMVNVIDAVRRMEGSDKEVELVARVYEDIDDRGNLKVRITPKRVPIDIEVKRRTKGQDDEAGKV